MAGYHKRDIKKGILGEWSKIEEEWAEAQDANEQENCIMELIELSDLLGAIDAYVSRHYGDISLMDLWKMTLATQVAFKSGHRR